ncbi:hypothetical protein HPP92_016083 [Vanilla planifolia]|uniref:Uncharacterized protein n=1 Tax=Vanilla planifolia TaxID=51239 RepID=A0A835QNH7_VANPL|nr:hypothetical protein HPP92_016083 [Vanilla planifolia]
MSTRFSSGGGRRYSSAEEATDADFVRYTVQIPSTPDRNLASSTNESVSRPEKSFISGTIFTGGFNTVTRGHVMHCSSESRPTSNLCHMNGCDGLPFVTKSKKLPCECEFSICKECYLDCLRNGGKCPGCKEPYGVNGDEGSESEAEEKALPLTSVAGVRVLRETVDDEIGATDFNGKCRRPLTRKIGVSQAIISPYRLLIAIRVVALGFFLAWRIRHPTHDAIWLWTMSITCEVWFTFSWLLDQLPKLCPVNRAADLSVLKRDLNLQASGTPKEAPATSPTTEAPLLTFEVLAETASFAKVWVPFCRKHEIEPRNPDAYFGLKRDFLKNKTRLDFVRERRRVKREYDEFKVRINSLPDSIRRRCDAYNAHEELRSKRQQGEIGITQSEEVKVPKATWMSDGSHWPGTWSSAEPGHSRGDHAGIIQVMLAPPNSAPVLGEEASEAHLIDTTTIDIRLPLLVYVSREKRPGYDHNKKAGAMNALVRSSAIMSNGPFILNLDCDHYIYNSLALREGICFMLDRGGDRVCFVQFRRGSKDRPERPVRKPQPRLLRRHHESHGWAAGPDVCRHRVRFPSNRSVWLFYPPEPPSTVVSSGEGRSNWGRRRPTKLPEKTTRRSPAPLSRPRDLVIRHCWPLQFR